MISKFDPQAEWLEADGLGGFASGTVSGIRTRRYHALLLTATTPPAGRMVLVNGFDAWVQTSNGTFPISLCLATGRYEDARDILVEWAGAVSEGMLPNRFPDKGETPEFNSLYEHLNEAGLEHVSEITDAEAPYTPRGCPFQAWSLGELLRLEHSILNKER
jgi:glycogen debranching enzyme